MSDEFWFGICMWSTLIFGFWFMMFLLFWSMSRDDKKKSPETIKNRSSILNSISRPKNNGCCKDNSNYEGMDWWAGGF